MQAVVPAADEIGVQIDGRFLQLVERGFGIAVGVGDYLDFLLAGGSPDNLYVVTQGSVDFISLLGKVTDHAIALLRAERGFVIVVGKEGELSVHASRDRSGDDPHARFSRSIAEKVIQSGEPVVSRSARALVIATSAGSSALAAFA
jgi:hypothetical protein